MSRRLARTAAASGPQRPAPEAPRREDPGFTRWIDLQALTVYTRARLIRTSEGVTADRHLQHKETFRARFKFDGLGRYSLSVGVLSGRTFPSRWDNTGWGTGDPQRDLAVRLLYLAARPAAWLELQYGGLPLVRGESTEITSYDEDGFIVGGRTILRRRDRLFFDEISLTLANLGDTSVPDVTKRLRLLDEVNYRHLLVGRTIGEHVAVSCDFTDHAGRRTVREAIRIAAPGLHAIDRERLEAYQRVAGKPASGFALSAEKAVAGGAVLGGGYARVDGSFGGLNGGRHGIGYRLFVLASVPVASGLTLQGHATRAVGSDFAVPQGTRVDVVLGYNLLNMLQRTPLVRPSGRGLPGNAPAAGRRGAARGPAQSGMLEP